MRRAVLVAMMSMVIVFGHGNAADDAKDSTFMQLKLKNSQAVLEGLALNDFKRIETGGEYLLMLSRKAEFQHLPTAEYKRQSDAFAREAETLIKMAKDKNLDGATLAYVQMTITCVECHKHVRASK